MHEDPIEALIEYLEPLVSEERKEAMQRVLDNRTRRLTVVMEDVYRPHNTAAIMRSCECFGVQDVHIVEERHSFRPSGRIARGAENWLTLKRYDNPDKDNLDACIRDLRAGGYKLAMTSFSEKAVAIQDLPVDKPLAILFGSEMQGVSEQAMAAADYETHIPMFGFTQSFNVSVSVALCLQELTRRIHAGGEDWRLSEEEKRALYRDWLTSSIREPEKVLRRFEAIRGG